MGWQAGEREKKTPVDIGMCAGSGCFNFETFWAYLQQSVGLPQWFTPTTAV